jgi:hypothetical protein
MRSSQQQISDILDGELTVKQAVSNKNLLDILQFYAELQQEMVNRYRQQQVELAHIIKRNARY